MADTAEWLAWDARRKVLEEAVAECRRLGKLWPRGSRLGAQLCADSIERLIGPEPTDG